jgi:hypothetical protein
MGQNDVAFPFYSVKMPMWDQELMPAFLTGLASRSHVAISAAGALSSFGASMNAFASIIVPADPDVPGDRAAGDGGGGTFFRQMIRLIQRGTVPELGAVITEDDARAVFAELDAQAGAAFGRNNFAQLALTEQEQLVGALLAGTLTPITVSGPNAANVLQSQARLMVIIVKTVYWTNFPEHRVRSGDMGFGSGNVIFSDPQNQISNPNTPGTGTAWDYVGWHYPLRKGVEDKLGLAFLEADVPHHAAQSEAALADLLARDAARTLINHD